MTFQKDHFAVLSIDLGNDSGIYFRKNRPFSSGHEESVVHLIAGDE